MHIQKDNINKAEALKATIRDIGSSYSETENLLNSTKFLNEITKVNIQEADDNLQVPF